LYIIVDEGASPFVVSHPIRQAQCDHAEAVAEVERAIHRNRDFLHVPGSQDGLRHGFCSIQPAKIEISPPSSNNDQQFGIGTLKNDH
jgi:hypothetical protein